jgi:hypothetical protein
MESACACSGSYSWADGRASDWSRVCLSVKMTMKILELVSEKVGTGQREPFEGQFDSFARIFRPPILLQSKNNINQH